MTESRKNTGRGWTDPDEVPDLTAPEWAKVIDATPVTRGRPKSDTKKISTTIRLSPEVVDYFKKGGPGWQRRIDDALRKVAGL